MYEKSLLYRGMVYVLITLAGVIISMGGYLYVQMEERVRDVEVAHQVIDRSQVKVAEKLEGIERQLVRIERVLGSRYGREEDLK